MWNYNGGSAYFFFKVGLCLDTIQMVSARAFHWCGWTVHLEKFPKHVPPFYFHTLKQALAFLLTGVRFLKWSKKLTHKWTPLQVFSSTNFERTEGSIGKDFTTLFCLRESSEYPLTVITPRQFLPKIMFYAFAVISSHRWAFSLAV